MKERPILFSGAMVRALLDGSKTQTRRIAKDVKHPDLGNMYSPGALVLEHEPQHVIDRCCPYGQPGDRLYVRETWGVISNTWDGDGEMIDWTPDRPATPIKEMPFGGGYYCGHVIYAADGPNEWAGDDDGGGEPRSAWHPSIHMPRVASRILLEITGVRVERLNECSEEDAIAEGIIPHVRGGWHWHRHDPSDPDDWYQFGYETARYAYEALWESINGAGSWKANPWVWVPEFKQVTP